MAYHRDEIYDTDITSQIAGHYREILTLTGKDL